MQTNVLHTITGLEVGGAEFMLARFLGEVDRSAFSSTVLSLLPPGLLRERIAKTRSDVVSIGMERHPRPRDIVRLAQMVSRTAPDLVHGWMYHGNVAATLGSVLGLRFVPVVWSVHHAFDDLGNEKPLTRRLIRLSALLSSRATAISYCSRASADLHEKLGFDPSKRVVIPNGVDCAEFRPNEASRRAVRQLAGIPDGRLVIGHVARAHPAKDQRSLVRAIADVVGRGYDVQGVFLGEGHADGVVREAAREFGIDDRITTPGLRFDVARLVPGFDVFALGSAWGESFSLAVAEAMACGVPSVVTDVGDCGWMVGETGLVVPPRDHEALASALARLLSLSGDERRALGCAARRRVTAHFSLALYVSRHLDLYDLALGNGGTTIRH